MAVSLRLASARLVPFSSVLRPFSQTDGRTDGGVREGMKGRREGGKEGGEGRGMEGRGVEGRGGEGYSMVLSFNPSSLLSPLGL